MLKGGHILATFIQSSKSFHFKHPNEGEPEFKVPFGFVGSVPDWVAEHPFFKLAVDGGDITFVGQNQESPKEPEEKKQRGRKPKEEDPAE